ncbi:unnamed protein product [Parajaminaea phylloscopi]
MNDQLDTRKPKRKQAIASSSFLDLKAQLEERRRDERPESSSRGVPSLTPLAGPLSSTRTKRKHRSGEGSDEQRSSARSRAGHGDKESSRRREEERQRALERKASLYHDLSRGLSGGVQEEDLRGDGKFAGLVDWDTKMESKRHGTGVEDTSSDEVSDTEARWSDTEELVEYQDDLGRTRKVPRNRVPLEYVMQLQQQQVDEPDQPENVMYGPQAHFPLLVDQARGERQRRKVEQQREKNQHFNAAHEVRNRGAAFYGFSEDESARAAQMEDLAEERKQTELARQIGVDADGVGIATTISKGEQRLEARRRFVAEQAGLLERKRSGQSEEVGPAEADVQHRAVTRFLDGLRAEWQGSSGAP